MTPAVVVAEEAEFLLSCGVAPERIAEQLGIKLVSVAKACYRAGRADLARPFDNAGKRADTHPCADCGAQVSAKATRCTDCCVVARELDPDYQASRLYGTRRTLTRRGLTRQQPSTTHSTQKAAS